MVLRTSELLYERAVYRADVKVIGIQPLPYGLRRTRGHSENVPKQLQETQ